MGPLKTLILLGQLRETWPRPLADLLGSGQVMLETAGSVHEAAARVIAKMGQMGSVRGLLIDPAILTKRDVELLGLVSRRVAVTMLLLPASDVPGEKARVREAMAYGALSWEDAAVALKTLVTAETPPAEAPKPAAADNEASVNVAKTAEKSVTTEPAARYDEIIDQRLVTDEELQALLGN